MRWPKIQWTPTGSGKEWGMKRLSGRTLSKASFVSEIQPNGEVECCGKHKFSFQQADAGS